ncbi:MAG: hypothetical protein PHS80_15200 [Methanothrix sp.]|nr:hypothetical protein [Methanothrix sp.]
MKGALGLASHQAPRSYYFAFLLLMAGVPESKKVRAGYKLFFEIIEVNKGVARIAFPSSRLRAFA